MLTDMECAILVEVLHVYLESINKKRSVTQKVTLLFLFISLNGYLSYFTSSNLFHADNQRDIIFMVQIRNAISILNVFLQ